MAFQGGEEIELHHAETSDVPPMDSNVDGTQVLDKSGLVDYLTHLQDLENEIKVFTFHPKTYLLNDVRLFINVCKEKAKDDTFGTTKDLEEYALPSLESLYITMGEKKNPRLISYPKKIISRTFFVKRF